MKRTEETVLLLRQVAQAIEDNPELYNQNTWEGSENDGSFSMEEAAQYSFEQVMAGQCNTMRCIAGWTCALRSDQIKWQNMEFWSNDERLKFRSPVVGWFWEASNRLGFTAYEAHHLFDSSWKPKNYPNDGTPYQQALAVADALRAIADGADVFAV